MATQADIVRIALSQNGVHDGLGYDETNPYAEAFGIDFGVAYCDIFVSWVFEQAGVPLPKMGTWISSGSQYCPESWAYAVSHAATVASYEAQPGFQVIFNWNGDSSPLGGESHTEIVDHYDASTGWLYTVGANSGPSNVDGFRGVGGVHRHAWFCPQGTGNSLIQGVIDTSKLVAFSSTEDLVLSPDDKAYFEDFKKGIITIVEGGLDPKKNPYAIEGFRDVMAAQKADHDLLVAVAGHLGVTV